MIERRVCPHIHVHHPRRTQVQRRRARRRLGRLPPVRARVHDWLEPLQAPLGRGGGCSVVVSGEGQAEECLHGVEVPATAGEVQGEETTVLVLCVVFEFCSFVW